MRHERRSPAGVRRRTGAAAVVLLFTGALAACGGSSSGDDAAPAKATQAAESADSKAPGDDAVNVTDSVMTGLTCQPDAAGVWSAQMAVTNTTDVPGAYAMRVAVVQTETSEVVGRQTLRVELAAGESLTVPFEELAVGGPEGLSCDPRIMQVDD
jgi:hypothetical protein